MYVSGSLLRTALTASEIPSAISSAVFSILFVPTWSTTIWRRIISRHSRMREPELLTFGFTFSRIPFWMRHRRFCTLSCRMLKLRQCSGAKHSRHISVKARDSSTQSPRNITSGSFSRSSAMYRLCCREDCVNLISQGAGIRMGHRDQRRDSKDRNRSEGLYLRKHNTHRSND